MFDVRYLFWLIVSCYTVNVLSSCLVYVEQQSYFFIWIHLFYVVQMSVFGHFIAFSFSSRTAEGPLKQYCHVWTYSYQIVISSSNSVCHFVVIPNDTGFQNLSEFLFPKKMAQYAIIPVPKWFVGVWWIAQFHHRFNYFQAVWINMFGNCGIYSVGSHWRLEKKKRMKK